MAERSMTDKEILAMPAGRELDALVGELVMEMRWLRSSTSGKRALFPPDHQPEWFTEPADGSEPLAYAWESYVRSYSGKMGAAWRVIERMETLGYWCQMRTPFGKDQHDDDYWAGFTPHLTTGWNGRPDHWTSAETLPLATCRAALRTLMSHREMDGNSDNRN